MSRENRGRFHRHTWNRHKSHLDSEQHFVDHAKCYPEWRSNPLHLAQ